MGYAIYASGNISLVRIDNRLHLHVDGNFFAEMGHLESIYGFFARRQFLSPLLVCLFYYDVIGPFYKIKLEF